MVKFPELPSLHTDIIIIKHYKRMYNSDYNVINFCFGAT